MSTHRAKKHHYVPQCLQRRFSFDGGNRIFYAERKDEKFGDIQPKYIHQAFYKKNYYTVTSDFGKEDFYEKEYYGRADSSLGRILNDTDEIFANRKIPDFGPEVTKVLRRIFIDLVRRTPDIHKFHFGSDEAIAHSIIEELANEVPSPEDESLLEQLNDTDNLRKHGRDIRMVATTGPFSPDAMAVLDEYHAVWAISSTKASFILPSYMIYRIGNGGSNGLANPEAEMWFPVHPQRAIVLIRNHDQRIPLANYISREKVREVNETAIRECLAVGSHSPELLCSLLGQKVGDLLARKTRQEGKKKE